jgi:hypothetical protein
MPRPPWLASGVSTAVTSRNVAEAALDRPHRIGWARLLKRVFGCDMT